MKHVLSAVLSLSTILSVPALAAPQLRVTPPKKTKNACIRKVARLSSTQKYEEALSELITPECNDGLGDEDRLWVELMQGVLHQSLEQTAQAEDAFCRALQLEPLASLPISKPPAEMDALFEKLRVDCPERVKAQEEKAKAEAEAKAAAEKAAAEAAAAPPPAAEPPPQPVDSEPALASSLGDAFELHAGIRGEADIQRSGPLPLWGAGVNGSVHLFHGLRAGAGLTALASTRFSSGPIFLLMADVRLAYPILPPQGRFGLHVYAAGGPLLYTLSSPAGGARAGAGLALDVSKVRVSLGGAYEWRSHYRLGYGSPMAFLEVGWKLAGSP
uniref:Tetratricopeptide repeat protein n=1 Tax=Vitiosangium cumulatum TaxID=1867796 RepID=A0A7D4XGS9_9BACT|nr:hypothetical protein [Vitiosangium cumulatum]